MSRLSPWTARYSPSPRRRLPGLVATTLALAGLSVVGASPASAAITPLTACTLSSSAAAMGPGEGVILSLSGVAPSPGAALYQFVIDGSPFGSPTLDADIVDEPYIPITYSDVQGAGGSASVKLEVLEVAADETPTGNTLCQVTVNLAAEPAVFWVTGAALPDATVGVAYHQDLQDQGRSAASCAIAESSDTVPGLGPATVSTEGALGDVPVTCAQLDGVPTTAGTYTFTLRAGNQGGTFSDRTFTITVKEPAVTTTTTVPTTVPEAEVATAIETPPQTIG